MRGRTQTPFPDGIGYLDAAWRSLSPAQLEALMFAWTGSVKYRMGYRVTRGVLIDAGLLTRAGGITDRGRDLLEWADKQRLLEGY